MVLPILFFEQQTEFPFVGLIGADQTLHRDSLPYMHYCCLETAVRALYSKTISSAKTKTLGKIHV